MALTFVGLLYMQFVYMEEIVKMREQHFSEGVKQPLLFVDSFGEKRDKKLSRGRAADVGARDI